MVLSIVYQAIWAIVLVKDKFSSNLTTSKIKSCQNYNGGNCYLYVSRTEICKCKDLRNIPPYSFYLGSSSKDFINDQ